jgi:hypothetical protein
MSKTLKDKIWYIISGDLCNLATRSICPKGDDGEPISCEWCKTQEIMGLLAHDGYGKMVSKEVTPLNISGLEFKVHPIQVFEPIKVEEVK